MPEPLHGQAPGTVWELLAEAATAVPDRPALVTGAQVLTFADWHRQAKAVSAALRRAGLTTGDAVWIDLPGRHRLFPAVYLGALDAGVVAVLGGSLTAEIFTASLARRAPQLKAVVSDRAFPSAGLPTLRSESLLRDGESPGEPPGQAPERVAVRLDLDADICFTSGTTIGPRGVVSTQALLHALTTVGHVSPDQALGTSMWHPFSLDTTQGKVLTLMAIASQVTCVMGNGDGRSIARDLVTHRPTWVYISPSLLRALESTGAQGLDWVQEMIFATDSVTDADLVLARRTFPRADLQTEYGTSEAGVAYTTLSYGAGPRYSVGKAGPGTEITIAAPDREAGPVLLRHREVSPPRYWDDPDGDATTFLADGWVRTGDVGRLDDAGYLYLLGREDDIVLRGGRNISMPSLAARISALDGVRDCAVAGSPAELLGVRIIAIVVLDPGFSLQDVRRSIRASVSAFELPDDVRQVESLPRNRTGKVDRRALAQLSTAAAALSGSSSVRPRLETG